MELKISHGLILFGGGGGGQAPPPTSTPVHTLILTFGLSAFRYLPSMNLQSILYSTCIGKSPAILRINN